MARRRKIKSLGEMGFTLLAMGGGVLLALSVLQHSPLTIMCLAPMAARTAADNALNTDLSKADLLRGTHFADAPRS